MNAGIGPADLARAERQIAHWGLSLEAVDHLLLTHSHYDHVDNASALRSREPG